ncbi:hypothetical protein ACGC1H_002165 [Rhizoctonia solani]
MDNALWFIVGSTMDKKLWPSHGWKKFDPTARSAHKQTSFRFPAPVSSRASIVTSGVDSERLLDKDMESTYNMWGDSWETKQRGRWTAGLKMPAKEEGGAWSRLAMAWKSEKVDVWVGMVAEGVDVVGMTTCATLVARGVRLFGLA